MKCWRSSYTTKSPNEEGDWDGHWTCAASFGFCQEAGGFIARVWMRCAMIIPGYIRHENSIYLFEGVVPTRLSLRYILGSVEVSVVYDVLTSGLKMLGR